MKKDHLGYQKTKEGKTVKALMEWVCFELTYYGVHDKTSVVMFMNVKSRNKDCVHWLKKGKQGIALSNPMNIIQAVSQTYLPSISLVSSSSPEV